MPIRRETRREKKEEIIWDKKKIAILLFSIILFAVLIFELKTLFLADKNIQTETAKTVSKGQVEGASTENLPDLGQSVQQQINNLKNEAQNINVVDVATSSPQVQKVINDLKGLQNLPQSQFKESCEKICNGL